MYFFIIFHEIHCKISLFGITSNFRSRRSSSSVALIIFPHPVDQDPGSWIRPYSLEIHTHPETSSFVFSLFILPTLSFPTHFLHHSPNFSTL